MKRAFWIALGAAAGVLVARRLSRAARELTPESVGGRLIEATAGLGDAVRDFADAVREAAAQREEELREALGIDDAGPNGQGRGADPIAVEQLVRSHNRRDVH